METTHTCEVVATPWKEGPEIILVKVTFCGMQNNIVVSSDNESLELKK
jgi:hypothetical protein